MDSYTRYPKKKGRGLAVASALLVLAVLGGMIWIALNRGADQPAPAMAAPAEATATPVPTEAPAPRAAIDLRDNPFVQIAKEASPSVVSISNKIRWFVDQSGSLGDLEQSSGSGVILTQDGYIITNQHVVEGAETLSVILSDGQEYQARLIGEDATSDLAVIKIDQIGLTPAKIGSSEGAQVGEFVVAIGSPLGNQLFGSVTLGIISAKDRALDISDSNRMVLMQTDAAINPGNSGGALYNIHGELIGINTIKYSYTSSGVSTEGLGFAIPIDNALPIVEELMENGKVVRPVLGIGLVMVDSYTAQQAGVPYGVLVRRVYAGSPAQKAGVREEDIITHIDGERIELFADLTTVLNSRSFGDEVSLTVYRNGGDVQLTVLLEPYENPTD